MVEEYTELAERGINVVTDTPEEFSALIKSDLLRLKPIVEWAGAKPN